MRDNWVKKIGIGTAAFGLSYGWNKEKGLPAVVDRSEIKRIYLTASKFGMTLIDTALLYEDAFKKALSANQPYNKFKYCYKIPISLEHDEALLKTLEKKYCLMIHHGELLLDDEDLFRERINKLMEIKETLGFEKLGVSVYDFEDCKMILDKHAFDIVQFPFNQFDTRFNIEELKERGVETHVRSIFARGELLRMGATPEECIDSVLDHIDNIDFLLVGIHNAIQLHQIATHVKRRYYEKVRGTTIDDYDNVDNQLSTPAGDVPTMDKMQ